MSAAELIQPLFSRRRSQVCATRVYQLVVSWGYNNVTVATSQRCGPVLAARPSPRSSRLARVAWIRRPARGSRPLTSGTSEYDWERLYGVSGPTQLRPARSARTWWTCWGRPSCPGGWHPADSTPRACRCARRDVSACSGRSAEYSSGRLCQSVKYRGGWNARIAFWSPPPNLLLQDSVLAGVAAS